MGITNENLGDAVKKRREELSLSQRAASDRSREIDTTINASPHRRPGIGTTSWLSIESGEDKKRQGHTLHLIDQTLRWPWGTARALLTGDAVPDGEPADGPCPCVPDHLRNRRTIDDLEVDESAAEVEMLRREVVRLAGRVNNLTETVKRLVELIDR
ncbi:MAG TPA: hypothetical protein VIG24_07560 [Acidimicrobiia bacterium]